MYAEWLKNHYLAKNNLVAALEMAQIIFHKRPWFAEYQKMRELALPPGNWEMMRQAALTFLEDKHSTEVLIEVALDEGNIERALQLLEATKPHGHEGYQWKYDNALAPKVAMKVAERAEEMYPHASLEPLSAIC